MTLDGRSLIFAPHCDDEVLGCGGTIARLEAAGSDVVVCVVTNAHKGCPKMFSDKEIANIRHEFRQSAEILKFDKWEFLDYPAPNLETVPVATLAESFHALIEKYKPKYVFLPFGHDLHKDHQQVYSAGLVACRPISPCSPIFLLMYETLSETEWGSIVTGSAFRPNFFVDISDFLERKILAITAYESQVRESPHPRSIEAIRANAILRGSQSGLKAAEGFMIERLIMK